MPQLRPHQEEIVRKVYEGFEAGHQCQLLWGVTGLGKTEIAISIMRDFANKYQTAAMVMDRIVLVDQTSMRLNKYNIDHGVLQGNHWRFRPHERIQVCSVQTLAKRQRHFKPDILIVDECHILFGSVIKIIKDNPQMKVLGLSATPFTKGLGDIFTKVVSGPTYREIIEQDWLVPLKVYVAKEIDMKGAKKVAGEWAADEVSSRGMKITGDVVAEWQAKTMQVFGKPVKTIVFSAGVAHGKDLAAKFKEAGYNFVSISYKEDDDFKRTAIEEFSKPDSSIHGLIATDILTRGFDVTDVMIGVSARPFSKSFSSHVQQIGRVMRPHPGKTFGLWLDHSGNFLRFKDDWDGLYTEGVQELIEGGEKTKPEPTEKEKKEAKCPVCSTLWTFKGDICGECGHVRKRMVTVENVAGEMFELNTGTNPRQERQHFYSELLHFAKMKGYKEGWSAHKYKEKFGLFPRGLDKTTRPTSLATANWIRSRMIAFSKGKARRAA